MKLAQLTSEKKRLDFYAKREEAPRPRIVRDAPVRQQYRDKLAAAVRIANGKPVYVNTISTNDHQRRELIAWAKTMPGWTLGRGMPEGRDTGRAAIWVKGGAK